MINHKEYRGFTKNKKLASFLTVGPWVDVNKVNSLNIFGWVTKCLGRICLHLSDIGHSEIQWYSSPRTPHVLHKRALYTSLFLPLLNKTLGGLCFFVRNFVAAILCLSGIVIFEYSEKENDICKSLYNIQLDLWLIIPNHCCIYWSHNLCLHEVIK